jgi:gliding motility-associated-like protein
VTVTDDLGCSSSVTFDVPIAPSPDATVTANGPICSGDTAFFEIIGHDGAILTYNFGGANSTLIFTNDTMYLSVPNVLTTLTMTLVSIDDGTCSSILSTGATVTVLPIPTVVITGNGPICSGDDAIFTLTGTIGAVVTYSIGSGPITSTTLTGGVATVTVFGATLDQTILLDSIYDGACSVALLLADTIIVNPVISITQNVEACENTNYIYPDGFTEIITANTSHSSNLFTLAGCDSTIVTNVTMNPTYNTIVNMSICDGTTITYPDGFVETITSNTSHTSNLLTTEGCDSIIVTNVTVLPAYTFTDTFEICSGDNFTFSDGTIHTNITVDEVYTSSFLSILGCDSIFVTSLIVNPIPIIDAGVDQALCEGFSVTLTGFNPSGAVLSWDNSVIDGVSFVPTATQTYVLTATSVDGCISTDDVIVSVNPNPVAAFSADLLDGCSPLEVVFTNLTVGAVSCSWDFGDGQSGTGCFDVYHTYTLAGLQTVSLTVVDANGCTNSATYTDYINVYEQPIANFEASEYEIDILDLEVLFMNTSINASTYIWDFGDGSGLSSIVNPTHLYPDEGGATYVVTLIANNSICSDTIQKIITILDVVIYFVPNTFSPDGDELNQTFQPVFTSGYDPFDYHMLIFNRWGEIIFETLNVSEGWDGTYNGIVVQDGVYTWKIDFKETMTDERHEVSGHVNLLR